MEQLLFTDLPSMSSQQMTEHYNSKKLWRKVSYEANGIKGNMLVAGELTFPKPVEINFNKKGYYKVFVCLTGISGNSVAEFGFKKDNFKTTAVPSDLYVVNNYWRWQVYEYAEEAYLGTFDLTDNIMTIGKPGKVMGPVNTSAISTAVLYVRLEKVDEPTKFNNKVIQYHFDRDYVGEIFSKNPSDYLGRHKLVSNNNCNSIIVESLFDGLVPGKEVATKNFAASYAVGLKRFAELSDKVKEELVSIKNQKGFEILSGFRMSMGNFYYPLGSTNNYSVDLELKDDTRCVLRNGNKATFNSYAYKEVREKMINLITSKIHKYFDGVSLFFNRCSGIALFEEPIINRVKELYKVDARTLPFSDERLTNVLCEVGTTFMKELREALDKKAKENGKKPYKINVIVFFDPLHSKEFGYDVETWAKENLIDSVSQGLMEYYEDPEDCLTKDGLVDVKKYIEKEKTNVVLKRYYATNKEKIVEGAIKFKKICDKYNKTFFGALPWESSSIDQFLDIGKALKENGIDKYICWNGNHIAKQLSKIDAVRVVGDKNSKFNVENVNRKILRITQFDGADISEFDVNWKG